MTIHPKVAQLMAGCDGERTLRQLLAELFASWDADWDGTLPLVLPVVQTLLERGVLVLAET